MAFHTGDTHGEQNGEKKDVLHENVNTSQETPHMQGVLSDVEKNMLQVLTKKADKKLFSSMKTTTQFPQLMQRIASKWGDASYSPLQDLKKMMGKNKEENMMITEVQSLKITGKDVVAVMRDNAIHTGTLQTLTMPLLHALVQGYRKHIVTLYASDEKCAQILEYFDAVFYDVDTKKAEFSSIQDFLGLLDIREKKLSDNHIIISRFSCDDIALSFTDVLGAAADVDLQQRNTIAHHKLHNTIPSAGYVSQLFSGYAALRGLTKCNKVLQSAQSVGDDYIHSFSIPGLGSIIDSMKIDEGELIPGQGDEPVGDDAHSEKLRVMYRLRRYLPAIHARNQDLASLVSALIFANMDATKLPGEMQKKYLLIYKNSRLQSPQGKNFLEQLARNGMQAGEADRIISNLFDADCDHITIPGSTGNAIDLRVGRHWKNTWDEKGTLPLVFTFSSSVLDPQVLQSQGARNDAVRVGDALLRHGNYVTITCPDGHGGTRKVSGVAMKRGSRRGVYDSPAQFDALYECDEDEIGQIRIEETASGAVVPFENITDFLTVVAKCKRAGEMTPDELQNSIDVENAHEMSEVLSESFSGVNENLDVNSATFDSYDWESDATYASLSSDNITNARKLCENNISRLKSDIENEKKGIEDLMKKKQETELKMKKKGIRQDEVTALQDEIEDIVHQIEDKEEEIAILKESKSSYDRKKSDIVKHLKNRGEDTRTDEEIAKEIKEDIEKTKELWDSIPGVKADMQSGTEIFVQLKDVENGPFGRDYKPRAKATIQSYDKETNTMEVRWTGADVHLGGHEGKISLVHGFEGLKQMLAIGNAWKAPSAKEKRDDRGEQVKGWSFSGQTDKADKDYFAGILQKVHFGSMFRKGDDNKPLSSDENDKVRYLGSEVELYDEDSKKYKKSRMWFTVEDVSGSTIKISGETKGGLYEKEMDKNSFMLFMKDHKLTTYTQNEVDAINGEPGKSTINDGIPGIQATPGVTKPKLWTTLNALKATVKFTREGITKKFKDIEKEDADALKEMMLISPWFRSLSKLKPKILGDAFDDMSDGKLNELNRKYMKEIDDAKKAPGDKGDGGSNGPAIFILDALEDVVANGRPKKEKDMRRIAGYYLYALEDGKNPYFRKLNKFAGQGVWVRGILGEEHQKAYLTWKKELSLKRAQDPTNEELRTIEAGDEAYYMSKIVYDKGGDNGVQKTLDGVFGNKYFGGLVDTSTKGRYNTSNVKSGYEDNKDKPFSVNAADVPSMFKNMRPTEMLGLIQATAGKVRGNKSYGLQRDKFVLMPILAGMTTSDMDDNYKKEFANTARKYGAPRGLYAKEGDGPQKLRELLSIASEAVGLPATETYDKVFTQQDITGTNLGPFEEKFSGWRREYGDRIVGFLSDPIAITNYVNNMAQNTSDSPQTQKAKIKLLKDDYLDKRVLEDDQSTKDVASESYLYDRCILSLSKGVARSNLWDFSDGVFGKDTKEHAGKRWNALNNKIFALVSQAEGDISDDVYQYVMRLFVTYMKGYESIDNYKLPAGIITSKHSKRGLKLAISDNIRGDAGKSLPTEVARCLSTFEDFFFKHKPKDNGEPSYTRLAKIFGNIWPDDAARKDPEKIKNLNSSYLKTSNKSLVQQKNKDEIKLLKLENKENACKEYNGKYNLMVSRPNGIYGTASYVDQYGLALGIPKKESKNGMINWKFERKLANGITEKLTFEDVDESNITDFDNFESPEDPHGDDD